MTHPGRLARCDHPGCTAELRVPATLDSQRTLREHGWYIRWDQSEALTYCPDHPPHTRPQDS